MLHSIRLFLIVSILFPFHLLGQTPCDSNPNSPFGLSSSLTLCAEVEGLTSLSFTIFHLGSPGTYEIIFPDGTDTILTDISGNISIEREFLFVCEDMPGDPLPPDEDNHFFRYVNQLIVTRTDCVDASGGFSIASFDFNVIPDPINGFTNSNTECINAPFIASITSDICDVDLVQTYQWFIDNIPVPSPEGNMKDLEDYSFSDPGTYMLRLEVTDYSNNLNCGPYSVEAPITITANPAINVAFGIDSSQLCSPIITVDVFNNSQFSDGFKWSSSSSSVSFSDPCSSNPTITIDNQMAGTYEIILEASNADCGSVTSDFEISTFNEQDINIATPLITCTESQISLCDFIDFLPTPMSINWSSNSMGVSFSNADTLCPDVVFSTMGNPILQATGLDVCGQPFSIDVPVEITASEALLFSLSTIDTLCENSTSVNLLNFVTPSDNIVSCNGLGVSDCEFDPSLGQIGANPIVFIDSCGIEYEIEIVVFSLGSFIGGDLTMCIGGSIDLASIQSGNYSGVGINSGVFDSSMAGVGEHPIDFESVGLCEGMDQFTITVVDTPVADFEITNESCLDNSFIYSLGETILLNSMSSTEVLSYTVLETGEMQFSNNASFVFNMAGEYNIEQVVETDAGECRDTFIQTILIEPEYEPTLFSIVDTSSCDSVLVTYSLDSVVADYEYIWSLNNEVVSNIAAPTFQIARPFTSSSVDVQLEVLTYCNSIELQSTIDLSPRFQVSFDILNDNNTVCSGETVYLQNTSTNFDSISFRDNINPPLSSFPDSIVYFNDSDTIQFVEVFLEGFKENCPNLIVVDTIIVLPVDTKAQFSLEFDDMQCSPLIVTLKNSSTPGANDQIIWGDNSTPQQVASLDEVTHEYTFANDTTITITLISNLCGTDTARKELTIYAAPFIGFESLPIMNQCENDTIVFIPFGDVFPEFDFDWDFGDTNTSHELSPTHVYESEDIFDITLTVTNLNGCSYSIIQPIEIFGYTGINLEIETSNIFCENGTLDLNIISAENDLCIDYGNGIVSSDTVISPYHIAGEYVLTLSSKDINGCTQDTSVLISVIPSIEVTILPDVKDTIVNLGDNILLDFILNVPERNIELTNWIGDSIVNPDRKITNVFPLRDGYINLSIVDEYGCEAIDSLFIWIGGNYNGNIYIPNVFSPNDDGRNDVFFINSKPNTVTQIKTFQIFNRWGEKVFECKNCYPDDPKHGWDGVLNGESMNPGVFAWYAVIEFVDGEEVLFKGDVTLLR